jgi:hypothetical protein
MGTLASTGQTAAQRAQAYGAVDDDAVCWSPAVPPWRDDDAGAPTAPTDGADGVAARKPEHTIGPSPRLEAPAPVLAQAHGARDQTHAAWREVAAQLTDELLRRHDSPTTLHA